MVKQHLKDGFEIHYSEITMNKLCRWSRNLKAFTMGWGVSGAILLPADTDSSFFKIWAPVMLLFILIYVLVDHVAFMYKMNWVQQDIKRITKDTLGRLNDRSFEKYKATLGK